MIRHYNAIKRIRVDNMENVRRTGVTTCVYWGETGTGKSRQAWLDAGDDAYIKNPNTKWWDGYKGQKNVIIDEFVGEIRINYLLTWFDNYPCIVECKGYSIPLEATNFWITSNLPVSEWFPLANPNHTAALLRRVNVTHFNVPYGLNPNPNPNP